MKKNTTAVAKRKKRTTRDKAPSRGKMQTTIGMDLGDTSSRYCAMDEKGTSLFERGVATTKKGITRVFGSLGRCRVVIEVGTHSPWVSRLLKSLGHEVIVANARRVELISKSSHKDDKMDARELAELGRMGAKFLKPIQHRSERAQGDLLVIRVRSAMVEARTALINTARGLAKSYGERLPACDADQMGIDQARGLPAVLREALNPLLVEVAALTKQIHQSNKKISQIAERRYPETARLKQVSGVGDLIATAYVLTIEDPARFKRSRDAGCYLGLRPKRRDSGQRKPQLGITKEGDRYLRKLLVQGAQYILGRRGPDTDLRRWGLHLAGHGGKNAKKRAVVAVARKLAVLLHRLWVSGEPYEPLRQANKRAAAQAAA